MRFAPRANENDVLNLRRTFKPFGHPEPTFSTKEIDITGAAERRKEAIWGEDCGSTFLRLWNYAQRNISHDFPRESRHRPSAGFPHHRGQIRPVKFPN